MRAATATYDFEDPRTRYSVRKSLDSYLNQLAETSASSAAGAINIYSSHIAAQSYIGMETGLHDFGQTVSTSPSWVLGENFLPVLEPPPKIDVASRLDEKVAKGITGLLRIAADEEFESGMESNLSVGLRASLTRYPEKTLEVLTSVLRSQSISYLIVGEILNILGRVENAPAPTDRASWRAGSAQPQTGRRRRPIRTGREAGGISCSCAFSRKR